MSQSQMFRSLEHRNARLFFLGLSISNVGTWIQMTAVSLLVYQRTGKATDVGISLFCQFLPMLALGVWAGAVSDRVDKRRMTFVTQTGQAILAILLGVLALAGWATLPVIYAVSFANGVVGAVDNPARRGFVIELVEPRHISNVIALNTAVMTGSRIFGPALAALLVRWIEPGWLFILNGASFAAILWPIWFTDTSKLYPSPQAAAGGRPVREALSFVRRNRRLLVVFLVFTVVGTFAFNYNVSLLKLADRRFDDRALFGWLLAVTSVGSLAGSLLTAARDRVGSVWFFGAAIVLGLGGLGVAWAPSIWIAYLMSIPLGAGGAAFIAALNAISQVESPPNMRGRLLALGAVAFLGTTPIGAPITGWVADHVSAEWSLGYGSVVTLICVAAGVAARRRSISAQVPTGDHVPAPLVLDDPYGSGVVLQDGSSFGSQSD
ncbi:MAG TPA: MFS transporter [Ilumatobacteraceae bacterium]|nr:MFS transporter [Ilumatobacteraceae bacterium]